jgi:single-strand DNA-binding protein
MRSLNVVELIGNLSRDPESRTTEGGTAMTTFSVATNRQWKTESGEQKEQADFHRIVAWNKLAQLCTKLLHKGDNVYVRGRLTHRQYESNGEKKTTSEVVLEDMLLLSSKEKGGEI